MNKHRLPDVTVAQLEYLLAVDQAPTWAAAAKSLGVSQSALSQGLAELQRRIGLPLFSRDGRKKVPLPEAQDVIEHARRVISQTSDLSIWAESIRSGSAGNLRVGLIDAAAVDHFGKDLRLFRQSRLGLELRISVGPSSQLLSALENGELDLAICVKPPHHQFTTIPLITEDLCIYSPPDMKDPVMNEWGPWVSFPIGSFTRQLIGAALTSEGRSFNVVAESHQPEVLREMVLLGMGWAVLPRIQAERAPAPLRPIKPEPLLQRQLVAATRMMGAQNPAATALVDLIKSRTQS